MYKCYVYKCKRHTQSIPPPTPSTQILTHRVIYHLLEDIAQRAAGLAPMLQQEVVLGTANVLQVFELRNSKRSEVAMVVAGCKVADGSIRAGGDVRYRVLRSGEVIHEGRYVVDVCTSEV